MSFAAASVSVEDDLLLEEAGAGGKGGGEAAYDEVMAGPGDVAMLAEQGVAGRPLADLGAQPPGGLPRRGFKASDIWSGPMQFLADAIQQKFWRGDVILGRKEEVEDPAWWAENNINLAASANAGPFQSTGINGRFWYAYPEGSPA